jgi:hypothetical protein
MREQCKPFDFPSAIHYDSSGRRLPTVPAPAPVPPPRNVKATAMGPGALLCRRRGFPGVQEG